MMTQKDKTIGRLLANATAFLRQKNIPNPRLDAEVLLGHCLDCSRVHLYASSHMGVAMPRVKQYQALLERRGKGEPIAYLLESKEFMGLKFFVSPAVLIPRPETESLVEIALDFVQKEPNPPGCLVDVGTGSGAIAITLACSWPQAQVYGLDISSKALAVARKNAAIHGVLPQVSLLPSDLLAALPLEIQGKVDVIIANLPYIPSPEIAGLMADVKNYEPLLALDGGKDGLALYRQLVPQAWRYLRPGGLLLMEIASGQAQTLAQLMKTEWKIDILLDLAGRERIVWGKKHCHKRQGIK